MNNGYYTIQENDSLQKIAADHGFRTTPPLIDANPDLKDQCNGNYDVLPPGLTIIIPDPRSKTTRHTTGQCHSFQLSKTRKDLIITLQTADKEPPQNGGAFRLTSAAGRIESNWINTGGVIQISNWNTEDTTAKLEIFLQASDLEGSVERVDDMLLRAMLHETVELHIGGMDPIVGTPIQQARAIQKILMNLGFYRSTTFDGDLTTPESKTAISNFQFFHGLTPRPEDELIDEETHRTIVSEVRATIAREVSRTPVPLVGRDLPLEFECSLKYGELKEEIEITRGFVEPAAVDQVKVTPLSILPRHFPEMAFVALSDSNTRQNPNVIRMRKESFIFLDTGRWLKTARNFSVIWGRHTYLCEWLKNGGGQAVPTPTEDRLDRVFFDAMNGRVRVWQHASAWWAPAEELDWSKLTVVIPDLHLMTGYTGKIFRGDDFLLDPELDLLVFAKALVNLASGQLQDQLQVVQLGDAYDLWIGCEPSLWVKTGNSRLSSLRRTVGRVWNPNAMAMLKAVRPALPGGGNAI